MHQPNDADRKLVLYKIKIGGKLVYCAEFWYGNKIIECYYHPNLKAFSKNVSLIHSQLMETFEAFKPERKLNNRYGHRLDDKEFEIFLEDYVPRFGEAIWKKLYGDNMFRYFFEVSRFLNHRDNKQKSL